MDILRIATAGSVDDGKSTLIGRLLYDTKSITKDKLEAVETTSKRKGLDFTDLSLLTDGLIAEREQGITIDVAHIYFSTDTRKYIIADTPGHIEYTRNMVTGASTAEASIVLVDARNGVSEQTRRHLSIFALLRIKAAFICINKMDLIDYDEEVYKSIKAGVEQLAVKIGYEGELHFIPIAAKDGDNVVYASSNMNWYDGKTLLYLLEELEVHKNDETLPARFPVQFVIRPHSTKYHDFRGYAGKLISGRLEKGEAIIALPSLKNTIIKSIYKGEEEVLVAKAGESILLELENDIDISRGNMIVSSNSPHQQVNTFTATVSWMDDELLTVGQTYLLQHGIHIVKAKISSIVNVLDIETMEIQEEADSFKSNDIGRVTLKTSKPIFADLYKVNAKNGVFILINEFTNNTVGVGFIESY
ncbi:MAG: sulfate adenylyltransferase subunit 1 [Chitinophagaceae bacterium]